MFKKILLLAVMAVLLTTTAYAQKLTSSDGVYTLEIPDSWTVKHTQGYIFDVTDPSGIIACSFSDNPPIPELAEFKSFAEIPAVFKSQFVKGFEESFQESFVSQGFQVVSGSTDFDGNYFRSSHKVLIKGVEFEVEGLFFLRYGKIYTIMLLGKDGVAPAAEVAATLKANGKPFEKWLAR